MKDYDAAVPGRPPTRLLPALRPGSGGVRFEECEHIVGEDDPDTALCGVDQKDVPWDQGLPVCQACLAVAEGRMS